MRKLALKGGEPIRKNILPLNLPYFDSNDEQAVSSAVHSGWVVGDGPKCREFEETFANYLGVKHALLTTSCTAALDLAFKSLGLSEGEAIVPDFTFTSTALAPILNGMKIKLCDVEYNTANIDPCLIEKLITKSTKAIVPVDYAGHPCRIDSIQEIADRYGLRVIHDAAQSCGSKFMGRLIGTQSLVTCFSFHATKNLVTGEGGCLVTNDDKIADRARVIRDKGTNKHTMHQYENSVGYYDYQSIGNSYVQSNILGALALSQLSKLDEMNEKRRKIAKYLNEGLKNIKSITIPYESDCVESNMAIYAIRIEGDNLTFVRDALRAEGIGCNTHYHPLHINSYYKNLLGHEIDEFPNANRVYKSLLRLPIYPQLESNDLDNIINATKKVMECLPQKYL